ncbi:MAG: hypothetical protein K2Q23_10085 [Bryobacteraceae bacterium]|nr:hypothetical protein [Bryobacteraceae bacterium]
MRAGFWIGIVGGLAVAKAAAGATPVYHQDVAPLLARYCLGCHREGGLGRIPLDRYDRAKRYAAEIRLNVGTRTMPPWKGIPGHGRFRQQRVLSVTEVETILRWTDEGTPEGSPPRAQAALRPGVTEWKLGKPDVIFRTPRYGVPATGYPEVRCFRIALELRRSAYVRAVDVRPGQRESVAHVRVFAAPAQGAKSGTSFDCFEQMDGLLERTSVGEWSAGSPVAELPAGMGRLSLQTLRRHGRALPGHPRREDGSGKVVDARAEPGHDRQGDGINTASPAPSPAACSVFASR